MSTTVVSFGIQLILFLIAIGGYVFSSGKRNAAVDMRLKGLEDRAMEDRNKNTEQHKEFYVVRDTVGASVVEMKEMNRRMGDLETDIKEILRQVSSPKGDK